ncbi:CPBP family intramembrane glutamic endopeptidase [Bacillus horti]|uniref:Membrane protease YdiL (CAAX protease family) n=1 Tax=Caldalkalibacillus horti TaxID=77523 RepID=A0ABT9VYV5_9BACI|nr:CPBP family intramembrane glutamic endopeptidase [Bacillus horti]MDQ0166158.1 membrane protease YdiL (CAAX protease family) [Bacillus horti]
MSRMHSKQTNLLIILSPLVIILCGFIIATLFTPILGGWSWVPLAITYWTLMATMVIRFGGKKALMTWFSRPIGKKSWLLIGIFIGFIPILGILMFNIELLAQYPWLTLFWLLFAFINPWFEQSYWRGLLLDAGGKWPQWLIISYSTVLFALSHPIMWGVFSIGNRSYESFAALLLMGVVWCLIRIKTKSLRWSLLSHVLVDIGNMSIFVFMNIYIPPQHF